MFINISATETFLMAMNTQHLYSSLFIETHASEIIKYQLT